jgi:hypothetical protein
MMISNKHELSKKSTKIKLTAGILAVLCLTAGAAVAYRIHYTSKTNQITIAGNTISITEDYQPPVKQVEGENNFIKKVQVTNEDNTSAYIRVFMDFSDSDIKDKAKIKVETSNGTEIYYEADQFAANFDAHPKWVYIPETEESDSDEDSALLGGYYYYTEPVAPGESTDSLMEGVRVTYEDATQIRDFDILVVADSIQTYVFDDSKKVDDGYVENDNSKEADGWQDAWKQYLERRVVN